MKAISLILTLAASLMAFIAVSAAAENETDIPPVPAFDEGSVSGPIGLREMVSVSGDVIYLGDLFTNVDRDLADRAVAYSPEPGRQATYGAEWLYRIAQYFKLDWRPETPRVQSLISRDSLTIDRNQIEEAILMQLVDQGVDPEMEVELANRNIRLYLPVTENPDIAIDDMKYDAVTQRFAVSISAPANSPSAQHYRLTGRVYKMTDVPVLIRQVSSQEIITATDVEWQPVRSDQITNDIVMDIASLIGMSPKRGIRPGMPVRQSEVAAPIAVAKKSLVMIVFQHPFMTLTAKGLALESGAVGDVIRITNVQSNIIVDAEVIGSGQAVVRSNKQLAMTQSN